MRLAHKVVLIITITVTSIIISMFYIIASHFDNQVEEHLSDLCHVGMDRPEIVSFFDLQGVVLLLDERVNRCTNVIDH